jgi:regulatory protein
VGRPKNAREYAFLLLQYRQRSQQEMRQRLKQKHFAPEIIADTIAFLKEKRFLDDAAFCRAWMSSRLKKPLGLGRITQELKIKGVEAKTIQECLTEAREGYSEAEVVGELARAKFAKLKGIAPEKARRRIYGYLLRRGFSPEIIIETLDKICKIND